MANDRIRQFITPEPQKIDNTPQILYECMLASNNFYEFLVQCSLKKITKKVLEGYIKADCCKTYGKTKKLLSFRTYFDALYGKNKITLANMNKKYSDEPEIKNFIINNGTVSKSGKTIENLNSEKVLLNIFDYLENEDIDPVEIMTEQINKFGKVKYTDSTLNDNRWFVLNWRNVIAPNIIIYNMKTGDIQYRKVDKNTFKILPLQDGDVIDVTKTEKRFGQKYIGKDENGVNIIAADIDKEYDVITQYEIIQRDFSKMKLEE